MKKFIVLMVLIASSLILCQCGGGGGGDGDGASHMAKPEPPPETNPPQLTNSAVFVASDESFFQQIGVVFKKISVVNTESGAVCDLRTDQTLIDVEALSTEIQLLNFANCPLDDYDSIQLVVGDRVHLTRDNITQMCTLDSFRLGESQTPIPSTCDASTGTCEAYIPADIKLSVDQQNIQTLNFNMTSDDLRDFPQTNCTATMSVSTLDAPSVQTRLSGGYDYAITGSVYSLDTDRNTFVLSAAGRLFNTKYTGSQPHVDKLVTFAQNSGLRVKVLSSHLDLATTELLPWKLFVKAEGTITRVGASTFDLTLLNGSRIIIDYRNADLSGGPLAVGQQTHVKLAGVTVNNTYLAEFIDRGEIGMEN